MANSDKKEISHASEKGSTEAALNQNQEDSLSNDQELSKSQRTNKQFPIVAWLPLLLLLISASATLIWLLIPGNRIFPAFAREQVITDSDSLTAAIDVNRALEERLNELNSALNSAICEDDGTLLMPNGVTIEGLLPPDPNIPAGEVETIQESKAPSILPPNYNRLHVSSHQTPSDLTPLIQHINERTVMLLAFSEDKSSSSTGFFIGPDLVISSPHFINNNRLSEIYAINDSVGRLLPAEIVKIQEQLDVSGNAFVLIRVENANNSAFDIYVPDTSQEKHTVFAAGFANHQVLAKTPRDELQSEQNDFIPEFILNDGIILSEQRLGETSELIFHSAPLSANNAGGPLIDICGRLIGVNTIMSEGEIKNLNFAQSAKNIITFLADTAALPQVMSRPCQPRLERLSAESILASN
ncbi:MAG: serine protease [Aestuariivita sp.]|nr:serine protease [Aestuariivita sp.]